MHSIFHNIPLLILFFSCLWIKNHLQKSIPFSEGILFCGAGRDIENSIPFLKQSLRSMRRMFPKVFLLIAESGSTDRSDELLDSWQTDEAYLHVLHVNHSAQVSKAYAWDGKKCRMDNIAFARNEMLAYAEMNDAFHGINIIIIFDVDISQELPCHVIWRVLRKHNLNFDAIISNGVNKDGFMYDTYALRDATQPFGPELLHEHFWRNERVGLLMRRKYSARQPCFPVYSAFNGLAVFRRVAIQHLRYTAYPTPVLDNWYQTFVNSSHPLIDIIKSNQRSAAIGDLPSIKLLHDIYYLMNSGYSGYPVVCEHVSFFLEMRSKGYDRIFVDPELLIQWDR